MNKLGRLSEVEMEIMQAVWGMAEPVTVARLQELFWEKKGWKTSTVATMLERIIAKGFLEKEMRGKANYYTVLATLDDYRKTEGRNLLSNLFSGSIKSFMAALADEKEISKDELMELREWLDESFMEDEPQRQTPAPKGKVLYGEDNK